LPPDLAVFELRSVRDVTWTLFAQHAADRLGPKTSRTHLIDKPAGQRQRGSIPARKKATAFKSPLVI
jgi:hypothetical protein